MVIESNETMASENIMDPPMLGEGHKWFDALYKVSHSMLESCPKFAPGMVKKLAARACSNARVFHEVYYENMGDWRYPDSQYVVPGGVHVSVPGLWIAEVFPPSRTTQLISALKAWKWSNCSKRYCEEVLYDILRFKSSMDGIAWNSLDNVVDENVDSHVMGCSRGSLPEPFVSVDLRLFQLGDGIAVVCAAFSTKESWIERLDDAWHSNPHTVAHRKEALSWEVSDRHTELSNRTRLVQDVMCAEACKWMNEFFDGAFACSKTKNPAMQMMLLSGAGARSLLTLDTDFYDSTHQDLSNLRHSIGIDGCNKVTCRNIRGLEIRRRLYTFDSDESCENRYILTGVVDIVLSEYEREIRDVGSPNLFSHLTDTIDRVLLEYALLGYINLLVKQYVSFRNSANIRYGRYSARQVDEIRQFVLGTSLDNRETRNDIISTIKYLDRELPLCLKPIEEYSDENHDCTSATSVKKNHVNFIPYQIEEGCKKIEMMDKEYRDAITDVVSLGTDRKALDVARAANVLALAALVISIPTCSCDGGNMSLVTLIFCKLLELLKSLIEMIW